MTDVDAGYGGDDEYRPGIPVPGLRFSGAARAGWQRVFGGWWPDERTVGVLLVAMLLGATIQRLLTADLSWTAFVASLQTSPIAGAMPWQQAVSATLLLFGIPADVLVVAGGVAMALRRGWGRWVAVAGLSTLVVVTIGSALLRFTHLPTGPVLREAVAQLLLAAGTALPIAVLLWSRPPQEDA